ncbi:MAG: MBL fold metallo-hydrolase [Clostridia bacterium]|nr:MBL fold metallo-hydrolase [Clostridia bacterium]
MYELVQAGARTYYFRCPVQVGVYLCGDGTACLIDGGSDKDAGKRILRAIDGQGWRLRCIFNTHSHADHIGGNRYLQEQTGCRVFAPGPEAAFTQYPILESTLLSGGYPPEPLRHKFLLAQASRAEELTDDVLPDGLRSLPLPGHCIGQVGFITQDRVAFLADSLCSEAVLDKYKMTYIYDIAAYLDTLQSLPGLEADLFIPAHVPALTDLAPLVQRNRQVITDNARFLLSVCREPAGTEQIIRTVFEAFKLHQSFEQYALIGSTVRSYLSWLADNGRVQPLLKDNVLLWQAVPA